MLSSRVTYSQFAIPILAVLIFWLCQTRPSGAEDRRGDVGFSSVHTADINRDVNVNVNANRGGCCFDSWGHPIAAASVATATAIAVGSIVASLPSGCTATSVGGVTYQVCGGVYYQPVYQGSGVQYEIVNQP